MKFRSDPGDPSWLRAAKLIWPYLAQHRVGLATGVSCLFVAAALRIIEPWPLQIVLDRVLVANIDQHPANSSADFDPITLLTLSGIAIVLIACVRALVEYRRVVSFAWIGNRVVSELRGDVFRHLQSLSLSFHTRSKRGDLTVRLVGDLNMIRDVAVTALLPLVASFTMLVGMSAIMLWMHWRLGLLAISIFPLFWFSAAKSSRKIHAAAKQQRSCEGALAATANESLSSVKVVQALSLENHFADAFGNQSKKSMREGVKTSRLSAALERKVDVLIALASALVLWQGTRYVLAGELTIGGLVVFLAYLKRGFKPLQDFAKYTGRLSKSLAAADRVMEILEESPDVHQLADAKPAPTFHGRIEFQDVTFAYAGHAPVLRNISFVLEAGQCAAIVGESGVGKSTLLSLICRLHDPLDGRILIDGNDIRDWTLSSLRSQQSIVMQDNAVFATTIRENISLIQPDASDEAIESAAKTAGAADYIAQLPQGYDTALGERGSNLSRGQIQRLAIARSTLQSTPVFLVDEPTTGLDETNERLVIDGILRACAGRTTLIVTHQLGLAARADHIIVLHNGSIAEAGSHRQLMRQGNRYAAMYRNQQAGRSKSAYALHR